MAGWDGGTSTIPVTGITVTGAGGSSVITTDNGTLQLTAAITPTNATNQTVTWTIANGTGQATISSTGLVTAVSNGTVTARATANDGSGVYGTLVITISSQVIPVTGITVTGAGGSSAITTDNGTLQLSAAITPTNATNQTVTWTIANGTGQATISSTGLVTAVSNGTVTARATANDGSGIYGTLVITISSQVIPVTGITVTGAGGSTAITTDNGTLQLSAAITPTNATNQTVTWTIANGTGQATISASGLVTAVTNGTVTARATANDGSGIYGTLVITITNQVIQVSVTIAASATEVTAGTLVTFTATPTNGGTAPVYQWKVNNNNAGTNSATFSYTPMASGVVTCVLTSNLLNATGNPATSNPVAITVMATQIGNNTINYINSVQGTICATASEGSNAVLSAPSGTVFIKVDFASYGNPTGTCPDFTLGSCNALTSLSVAEGYLLGKNSATIPASNAIFGDPCSGTVQKTLHFSYLCINSGRNDHRKYSYRR